MLVLRRLAALLIVSSAAALLAPPAVTVALPQTFPDREIFIRNVREAIRRDWELQSQFTYIEERRDVRISKLGKVEVGPRRTFEVFPSPEPGRTYKRLIAVDGQPLSAEALARGDREHQKHRSELAEQERNDTPKEREARLRKVSEEKAEREAILGDALEVYESAFLSRDTIQGEPVFVISLTPSEHARPKTRAGRWMKKFAGRVWVAEATHQIVKLDLRAVDDVAIGWGFVGRVHEGSRLLYSRRRVHDAWLPAALTFDATGRTLLFRRFDIDLVTTYSGYKRIP